MKRTIRIRRRDGVRQRYHVGRTVKVPPGLRNVRFHKDKNYEATGLDEKGRTQYIYHPHVTKSNASKKYKRIQRLVDDKDKILRPIINDAKDGNVEAQAVYTMFKTGFRPGSDVDTKAETKAYGTITLRKNHVKVNPKNKVKFDFIGKKGVRIKKEVRDKLLADIMTERKEDTHLFDTKPNDVRDYFAKKTGGRYKLKDLRTLKAFEIADEVIAENKGSGAKELKKEVAAAVSKELGNTPAVASQAYIAPKLEELKEDDSQ